MIFISIVMVKGYRDNDKIPLMANSERSGDVKSHWSLATPRGVLRIVEGPKKVSFGNTYELFSGRKTSSYVFYEGKDKAKWANFSIPMKTCIGNLVKKPKDIEATVIQDQLAEASPHPSPAVDLN